MDRDIVSRSDLHRQHLYSIDSIGYSKVEAAAKKLRESSKAR
ncbi:ThiF family adenylyltransferase [Candidatus Bathyarchaeota archaeon]|nr:ThiF family adenylyltransferase [Candidatus Bathyarchaeota archaeon]